MKSQLQSAAIAMRRLAGIPLSAPFFALAGRTLGVELSSLRYFMHRKGATANIVLRIVLQVAALGHRIQQTLAQSMKCERRYRATFELPCCGRLRLG